MRGMTKQQIIGVVLLVGLLCFLTNQMDIFVGGFAYAIMQEIFYPEGEEDDEETS